MDKQIEAMKRKIALAEARKKLKSAMSGGNGHAAASSKSSIPTPDAAMDSDTAMPSLRRVQSMDPSSGLDGDTARSSPAAHETGSIKLPKNSDIAKAGVVDRAQRVRVLSQSLPGMQSRLQAKKTKLRLLQSQMSRLEKEIEQEDADRQVAEEELHGLQELVTPENAVSHAPTSDVPEPETAQQGLDDAQIAQQLASTIADKNQLEGRLCPKGSECEYQHFESMKLPDDQILLQLGGTNIEGPERVQYNNGLRELLQDMRQRNIKDFPSIAQGIVDYHNRFTGDPSRILTLGDVLI
ncbi:hypothetical protein ACHAQA_002155 [Verticillium albo-atrum]